MAVLAFTSDTSRFLKCTSLNHHDRWFKHIHSLPPPPNHSPLPHQQVCKVSKSTPARGFKNIKIDFSRIEAIKHITQKKTDLQNSFFWTSYQITQKQFPSYAIHISPVCLKPQKTIYTIDKKKTKLKLKIQEFYMKISGLPA